MLIIKQFKLHMACLAVPLSNGTQSDGVVLRPAVLLKDSSGKLLLEVWLGLGPSQVDGAVDPILNTICASSRAMVEAAVGSFTGYQLLSCS